MPAPASRRRRPKASQASRRSASRPGIRNASRGDTKATLVPMTAGAALLNSPVVKARLDRSDAALLAALALAAMLGTWTSVLMVNDGAVFLAAGWFGNSWDLYFSQNSDRWLATYVTYGPAWAARQVFGLSATTYMVLAHLFYL